MVLTSLGTFLSYQTALNRLHKTIRTAQVLFMRPVVSALHRRILNWLKKWLLWAFHCPSTPTSRFLADKK